MFAIRSKQHAKPVDVTYYNAWPLPSAGFVPLMQSFCKPENGVRNEFGFLEYPNSTAKEMILRIEKILRSKWSSTWFSNETSNISPFFTNDKPTDNLNKISAKLTEILLNNSNKENDSVANSLKLDKNRYVPLKKVVKIRSNNASSNLEKHLVDENTLVDLYELYAYTSETKLDGSTSLLDYIHSSENDKQTRKDDQTLNKQKRVELMHSFFCDKQNFKKIIIQKSSKKSNYSSFESDRLCNMTNEELSELDDDLSYSENNDALQLLNQTQRMTNAPDLDSNYINDLDEKLKKFLDFQVKLF